MKIAELHARPTGTPTLVSTPEDLIERWEADIVSFRRNDSDKEADGIERKLREITEAFHEYLTWISEPDAELRSGHTKEWLRDRFKPWQRSGHARKQGRVRWYRMVVVPQRERMREEYEAGLRAADRRVA